MDNRLSLRFRLSTSEMQFNQRHKHNSVNSQLSSLHKTHTQSLTPNANSPTEATKATTSPSTSIRSAAHLHARSTVHLPVCCCASAGPRSAAAHPIWSSICCWTSSRLLLHVRGHRFAADPNPICILLLQASNPTRVPPLWDFKSLSSEAFDDILLYMMTM